MNDFIELRKVITNILRWWWLLILLTTITAIAGYMVSLGQTRIYQATTAIIVGQSIQATNLDRSDIQTSELLAQTYANIARRQPVLQGVIDTLSLDVGINTLKNRIRVDSVSGTQLLELRVNWTSPEGAKIIADEIAQQLILLSPTALQNKEKDENQKFVRWRIERLQAKIEAGQSRLEELEAAMTGSLSGEQVRELQTEINDLESLIADWENNYTQLLVFVEGEQSANYLAVIEPAQAGSDPIRPRTFLNTLIAGMMGLMLGMGLALLLDYLDDTLKSTDDFSQSLGLTALGSISRIQGKNYSDKLITAQGLFSPVAEAYRMIRSNIQFMSVDRPSKSIVVTSSGPSEGKSTTTANLGIVMAQAGLNTIIVDADLRRPTQHEIFQIPNELAGLTDLIRSSEYEITDYLKKTGIENLQVITSGVLPPNPAELLGSQRMKQLLTNLEEVADVVIYDTPPALAVTDAVVLSNRVDGVVLVTMVGQTRHDAAKQAIQNLKQAGAHLLGGVVNLVSTKKGRDYQTYYSPSKFRQQQQISGNQLVPTKLKRRRSGLSFFR